MQMLLVDFKQNCWYCEVATEIWNLTGYRVLLCEAQRQNLEPYYLPAPQSILLFFIKMYFWV